MRVENITQRKHNLHNDCVVVFIAKKYNNIDI